MKKVLIAAIALALPFSSYAGEAAKQIQTAMGGKIVKSAPSIAPGFTAIMAEREGKNRIFYESNDGKVLIYGMMYDAAGNNLTALDAARLSGNIAKVEPPSYQQNTEVQAAPAKPALSVDPVKVAASGSAIKEGKGKVVYVVFDPNCPFCKQLHNKTRGYLDQAEIHWIPVGILTPAGGDSQRKAAAVLRGGKKVLDDVNNIKAVDISKDEADKLGRNLSILASLNSTQVPMIISKDINTVGLPSDQEIDQIFGGKK